jgi:hypothetical protein
MHLSTETVDLRQSGILLGIPFNPVRRVRIIDMASAPLISLFG